MILSLEKYIQYQFLKAYVHKSINIYACVCGDVYVHINT